MSAASSGDEFILVRRPSSKSQRRLVNAEGAALLPDRAKGAAGELSDLGAGKLAREETRKVDSNSNWRHRKLLGIQFRNPN